MMTSCPSFGNEKNCQVEHYFPAIFLCLAMKLQLSTAPLVQTFLWSKALQRYGNNGYTVCRSGIREQRRIKSRAKINEMTLPSVVKIIPFSVENG